MELLFAEYLESLVGAVDPDPKQRSPVSRRSAWSDRAPAAGRCAHLLT